MSDTQSWQALFPKFPESQISIALEILLTAGKELRKTKATEREDDISRRLLLRIKQNAQFRNANLDIESQFNVHDPRNIESKLRGIPDLTFKLLNAPKPVPYFAVEAKRLRFNSPDGSFNTGNSEYAHGGQGIRCFTDERYAEGLNAGSMLGYVYDGEIDSAKQGITQLIEKHAKLLKCKKPHRLIASKLPSSGSGVDETIHALNGGDFRIFHIFLAV
jgi:hypothetical protein